MFWQHYNVCSWAERLRHRFGLFGWHHWRHFSKSSWRASACIRDVSEGVLAIYIFKRKNSPTKVGITRDLADSEEYLKDKKAPIDAGLGAAGKIISSGNYYWYGPYNDVGGGDIVMVTAGFPLVRNRYDNDKKHLIWYSYYGY